MLFESSNISFLRPLGKRISTLLFEYVFIILLSFVISCDINVNSFSISGA